MSDIFGHVSLTHWVMWLNMLRPQYGLVDTRTHTQGFLPCPPTHNSSITYIYTYTATNKEAKMWTHHSSSFWNRTVPNKVHINVFYNDFKKLQLLVLRNIYTTNALETVYFLWCVDILRQVKRFNKMWRQIIHNYASEVHRMIHDWSRFLLFIQANDEAQRCMFPG